MAAREAPIGINTDRVTSWLEQNVEALRGPLRFDRVVGGASNLTFVVHDSTDRRLVLRRPPTGHVLARAHDMEREYRVIRALGPTAVPVAPALGLCTDEGVNGAPFYVMGYVEGTIVFDRADAARIAPDIRPIMTRSLVETLADLHSLDPDEIGLGDLGRKEDYCARQLRRWKRQVDEGSDRDLPLLDELHTRMVESVPPQQGAGIVHGDYRLDNCMMSAEGHVAAVLDWELCTLGDTLADVAGMVTYWGDSPEAAGRLADMPTAVEGFGSSAAMLELYASRSGRDLSAMPWYVAFQHWRLACIMEGVRVRYAMGAMGEGEGDAYDDETARAGIDHMLHRARAIIDT